MPNLSYPAIRARLGRFLLSVVFATALCAAENKTTFDIPSGDARPMLRLFAQQAGREIVFPLESVEGVKTNAIKGDMTPRQALDRMLASTGLTAGEDTQTGAYAIKRAPLPSAGRAARALPTPRETDAEGREVVKLNPFEVTSDTNGYYSSNTMSGTRLNSKIEDLGASITVITKEQMQDFALLDINDIFSYEVSTEGTGNYTDFAISASNGQPIDNTQLDPLNANRVRGIGSVNQSWGNFEMSGRKPIDPVEIDGVEISRGPNSSVFGIGNPAGTVNSVPATANLNRNFSTFTARVDSNEGYRSSLDLNRVLAKGRIAVRGSAVYQHDAFDLKPSGTNTRRLNGMVKVKPFRATEISATYSFYKLHGNRPNGTMPRDAISRWRDAGAPTWDPVTSTAKINGQVVGTFLTSTPVYFNTNNLTYSQAYIDQSGLSYLGTGRTTSGTNPGSPNQTVRLMNSQIDPSGVLLAQPLLADNPTVSSKDIYDWTRLNLSAANRIEEKSEVASVILTHIFLDSQRQTLALQLGWLSEQTERYTRNALGGASGATIANVLQVDVNERMLDGSPNPYFLRPFLGAIIPDVLLQPLDRETYRAQLGYQLNFQREQGWKKWLGTHQASVYSEYKDVKSRTLELRDAIISNHSWATANQVRGATVAVGPLTSVGGFAVPFQRYYLGDGNGYNVDYSSTAFRPGTYTLNWGSNPGTFNREQVQIGSAPADHTGGIYSAWTELKTQGATLQSHFLNDRVVTTFGIRKDKRYTRNGASVSFIDGTTLDYENAYDQWAAGDWLSAQGQTKTAGVVVKPLRWLNVYYNKSDSFQPADLAYSLNRKLLPDPSGNGKDYGVAMNLFNGKLVMRVNRYINTVNNARNGDSSNIAKRAYRIDFSASTGSATVLQRLATGWVTQDATNRGITLTPDQVNQTVAGIMKLPVEYLTNTITPFATDDLTSKGWEVEVNYNPANFWTMKLNLAQQEAINSQLAQEVTDWISARLPVWQSVIDPTINRPYFVERYNNAASPADNLQSTVTAPLKIAQAMAGKSRPQIREYRVNYSTNFRLAGITDNRILKRFNVGGALRWEDKGSIGYWGVQKLPAIITDLDPARPIYDKAHLYADAFIGYRTKILSDKVTATYQLNVRNIQETGRLQPIVADPDGSYVAYRIISPRLFILSATFGF